MAAELSILICQIRQFREIVGFITVLFASLLINALFGADVGLAVHGGHQAVF